MTAVHRTPLLALAVALAMFLHAPAAVAGSEAQALVDKARLTVEKLLRHPDTRAMRGWVDRAKGVLIIPNLLKAGFVIGAEGGQGVLLARNSADVWSQPAFFAIGTGSFGLQIGFQDSEVLLVIMTDRALRAIIDRKVKLGADASVAVGPVGIGVEGATTANLGADILAYALTRGAYVGASVEGSVVVEEKALNASYYGSGATARSIVIERLYANPGARSLIRTVTGN